MDQEMIQDQEKVSKQEKVLETIPANITETIPANITGTIPANITGTETKEVITREEALNEIASLPDDLRDKLDIKIREHWDELVAALVQLAQGVWREEIRFDEKKGETHQRIYQEKPDKEVAQYLLNQIIGKPKETQVMEGRVIFQRDF